MVIPVIVNGNAVLKFAISIKYHYYPNTTTAIYHKLETW